MGKAGRKESFMEIMTECLSSEQLKLVSLLATAI